MNLKDIARKTKRTCRKVYETYLKGKGFESFADYQRYREDVRRRRQVYRDLGKLVTNRLDELLMSRRELAEKMGCSPWAACMYADGKLIPKEENLRELYDALELGSYKIISPEEFVYYFGNSRKQK